MCFCWHCWHCLVGTACFLDLTSQLFAHAICFIGHTSAFWVNYMKLTDSIYTIFLIRTPFSAKRWCSYFARDLCLITLVTPNVRCIPRHRDTRTVARVCVCVRPCVRVSVCLYECAYVIVSFLLSLVITARLSHLFWRKQCVYVCVCVCVCLCNCVRFAIAHYRLFRNFGRMFVCVSVGARVCVCACGCVCMFPLSFLYHQRLKKSVFADFCKTRYGRTDGRQRRNMQTRSHVLFTCWRFASWVWRLAFPLKTSCPNAVAPFPHLFSVFFRRTELTRWR